MLQAFYKLNPKPKTIPELKVHCSRYGMTCRRLSQSSECMHFGRWWTFWTADM